MEAQPSERQDIEAEFKEKATLVSALIHEADSISAAFNMALSLCKKGGTIAAPEMEASIYELIEIVCRKNGITLLKDGLRKYTSGIDMGITFADFGIAETGTIVLCSDSEDKRLATMISDIHVALLYRSDIRATALEMADEFSALTARASSYTAFITGASRTADIERVLAIGVHGPLELHIIIITETSNPIAENVKIVEQGA